MKKKAYFYFSSLFALIFMISFLIRPKWFNVTAIEENIIAINSDYRIIIEDNNTLFNLTLKYILNARVCEDNDNIMVVTSYFGNVETRSAMRRAYSTERLKSLGFRRVFLLGIAPEDQYTNQNAIEDESRRFQDIVQGNFKEAYRNLTYKHVMGIKWVNKFCNSARYIIKMDDDIVVNVLALAYFMKTFKAPKHSFSGYILKGMQPKREPFNKWYVTKEEFNDNVYPPFVSGWFYITTPEVYNKLSVVLSSQNPSAKYFWIDDVYVTGILPKLFKVYKIKHYDISKYFAVHSEYIDCCLADIKRDKTLCDFLIGPNGGDNNLFYVFNEVTEICFRTMCKQRKKPIENTCVAPKKTIFGKGNPIIENYKLH